jgi:Flp pilus assembly protein TadD
MELKANAVDLAYDAFAEATAKDPSDSAALDGLLRAAVGAGRLSSTTALLRNLAANTRSVPAMVALSKLLAGQGQFAEALEAAKQAATLEPDDVSVLEQLCTVLADQGDVEGSERVVAALETSGATRTVALFHRARLEYVQGRFARAVDLLERAAGIDRRNVMVFNLLGGAYESLGDNDRARRAFEASLQVNPRDPAVLLNLGTIALRSADPTAAAERFAEALYISPGLKPALRGLADALDQQGRTERAETIRKHLPAS